jgi:UDPglucose--hexose-1-phosphate uridylyltransferase
MKKINFAVNYQKSVFHNPFQNNEILNQPLEIRTDPLTGHQSVFNPGLEGKSQILFPDTDYEYMAQRAQETIASCFLCPADWRLKTPKYPKEFISEGILEFGQAALFPNLFPVAAYHSVIRLGEKHFRMLNDITPDLLHDGFTVALDFVRRTFEYDPTMCYPTLNINYMLPAGASLMHPHMQILNSPTPSTNHQLLLKKCGQYKAENSASYFTDLVNEEKSINQRYIGKTGEAHWITAFSPKGHNETFVVWPGRQNFLQFTKEDIEDLSRGLSHILKLWHAMKLSSFNFACFSAPLNAPVTDTHGFSCFMRIVNRQNVTPHHRTDDYFLQKMLGNELILNPPEKLAQWMKKDFPEK